MWLDARIFGKAFLLTLAALVGPFTLAVADDAPAGTSRTAVESDAGVDAPAPSAARKVHVSPMFAEMRGTLDAERSQLAVLHERFLRAATPAAALAIQREIERLKADTEVALLRIQATWARRAGKIEVATRIEAAITELITPREQPTRNRAQSTAVPSGK